MTTNKYLAPDPATGAAKATTASVTSTPDALVALGSDGKLDDSLYGPGVGLTVQDLPQTGALAAGDYVNVYTNAGVATARKADANSAKVAKYFVKAATSAPGPARCYAVGQENTAHTGLTPGVEYFLSDTTPGGVVDASALPSAAGTVVQSIGVAVSATKMTFEPEVRWIN